MFSDEMYIPTRRCFPRPMKVEFAEPIEHTKSDMKGTNSKDVCIFSRLLGNSMEDISWGGVTDIAILHACTSTPINGRFTYYKENYITFLFTRRRRTTTIT